MILRPHRIPSPSSPRLPSWLPSAKPGSRTSGGVMHNGVVPFTAACDACARFRLEGGVVLLLSNAPRPAPSVVEQLDRIGVPRFAYDTVLTSGDAARALVGAYRHRPVFPLGPERDLPLYEGLEVVLSDAASAEADFVHRAVRRRDRDARRLRATCCKASRRAGCRWCAPIRISPSSAATRSSTAPVRWRWNMRSSAGQSPTPGSRSCRFMIWRWRGWRRSRDARSSGSQILAIGDGIRTDIKGAAAAEHRQLVRGQRRSSRGRRRDQRNAGAAVPRSRRAPHRGDGRARVAQRVTLTRRGRSCRCAGSTPCARGRRRRCRADRCGRARRERGHRPAAAARLLPPRGRWRL